MNQITPSSRASLWRILIAQAQVVFNDNAAKLALVGVIQVLLAASPAKASLWVSIVAMLLVLPFILFSPVCGWLADRYSKRDLMAGLLVFQVFVMALMMGSIFLQNLYLAVFSFFLLAMQSTMFSPAKQGILKEVVGSKGLSMAVGWMELLTMCAILLGSFAGGWAFDYFLNRGQIPWHAALSVGLILSVLCVLSVFIFRPVEKTPSQMAEPFRGSIIYSHFQALGNLWSQKPLRLAALGVAYIYSLGGVFYLIILQAGREVFAGQSGATSQSGLNLLMLGLGVAIGAICAAGWGKRRLEMGVIAIGGLTLPVFLFLLGLIPSTRGAFNAVLFFMGMSAGIFIVPLNVFLQDNAPEAQRGRILAAANLMTNIGGILAVGLYLFFSNVLGLSSGVQFLILVIPTVLVALYVLQLLPESIIRVMAMAVLSLFYRVSVKGEDQVPKHGGVLLVCNHVSYVDAIILQLGCPRVVRFIAYEDFFKIPVLCFFLRLFKTIPISSKHAKDAIRIAADRLAEGEAVCIFPEGELTRTGKMNGFRKGFELIARRAGSPVVPVHLDSLWGSIFSFKGGRYFAKIPSSIPWHVTVSFGAEIPSEKADAGVVRQRIMDLGERAFSTRHELEGNIGYAALNCLKRKPFQTIIIDRTMERREINRCKLLAASLTLAGWLRANCAEKRIGIVLPPGIGGSIANLGVTLAGKVPVNLNVTAGVSSAQACLRRGEIKTILSAEILRKKFPDFPWIDGTVDLGKLLGGIPKARILGNLLLCLILPARLLALVKGVKTKGGQEEAILLFTSGSSGEPKGVVLTHSNLLGNIGQINSVELIQPTDSLLGCLPLFHSFGLNVTLWYVFLRGCKVVTVPSPLEARKIGDAVRDEKVTVMLSTATFIRGYMRKLEAADLASLRFVIAGAEKMPVELYNSFKEKFGVEILEGYGLTETSPVTNVSLPDPVMGLGANSHQSGHRLGSVGRLLPGLTARIIHPDTAEELPLTGTGILKLKGPNIFKEYLGEPERTASVKEQDWFSTGDIARFDEDGFMYIEGRLSRFSKIGGEMVPHGTVETKIAEALSIDQSDGVKVVIVGIPDDAKGESLVLLTTLDLTVEELKKSLTDAGLPNLWIPRMIKKIETIPVLPTGKLDLAGCKKIGESLVS